jgi:SAM-dependent methyltransferase
MSHHNKADLTAITRLYEGSLAEHGVKPLAVGWRDEASHRLRFGKLASVIEKSEGVCINDLGCGYGAFYEYLVEVGVAVSLFRGYDISEKMVLLAKERVPNGEFIVGDDLDRPADYSFASGIFNVRLQESEGKWHSHIEQTLSNMFEYSTRGFAFNLLSTYVDYREPHLFYGDPLYFFNFCKRRFSRHVSLLHDYPLFEWTMTVNK